MLKTYFISPNLFFWMEQMVSKMPRGTENAPCCQITLPCQSPITQIEIFSALPHGEVPIKTLPFYSLPLYLTKLPITTKLAFGNGGGKFLYAYQLFQRLQIILIPQLQKSA
jgi:hypothetical protein